MNGSKYILFLSDLIRNGNKVGYVLLIFFLLLIPFKSKAQAVFSAAGTYTQDFGTVTQPSWTDNTTYLGWYALSYQITTAGADPYRGTTNIQTAVIPPNPGGWSVYQCNGGTDMKLGSRPSNSSGGPDVPGLDGRRGIGLGLCMQNTLSAPIASIRVDFDWYQLSLAENGNEPNNFFFSYFVSASNLIGSDLPNNAHPYTNVAAANYVAPNSTAACCSSQISSFPCNVTGHISVCIPVTVAVNNFIMLRWWDPNNGGNDHHSAIDNISLIAYSDNSCLTILPIELVSFEAKHANDKVELTWITASEKNNNYFTVERSADGVNFESISVVKGAGNSNGMRSYKDYDLKPLDIDVAYYRLKQTDFDGTFTYSKMVAVGKRKLNASEFSIMPNPSENGIFTIASNQNEISKNSTVEILDYTGRLISENVLQTNSSTIDLSSYSKGLYIVRITSDDKVTNHKIIYR